MLGVGRTFGRLQENVFWESMRKDVTEFVRNYVICQQMKTTNLAPYGLLQPFPVPNQVSEDISFDFIIDLPSFQNNTVILVEVCVQALQGSLFWHATYSFHYF